MATGFQLQGQCFASALEAASYACGNFTQVPASSAVMLCTYANARANYAILTFSQYALNNNANPIARSISLPLQPCDLSKSPYQPFDYAYAGSIWSLAFTFVIGLYLVSAKAGVIVNAIRRW